MFFIMFVAHVLYNVQWMIFLEICLHAICNIINCYYLYIVNVMSHLYIVCAIIMYYHYTQFMWYHAFVLWTSHAIQYQIISADLTAVYICVGQLFPEPKIRKPTLKENAWRSVNLKDIKLIDNSQWVTQVFIISKKNGTIKYVSYLWVSIIGLKENHIFTFGNGIYKYYCTTSCPICSVVGRCKS